MVVTRSFAATAEGGLRAFFPAGSIRQTARTSCWTCPSCSNPSRPLHTNGRSQLQEQLLVQQRGFGTKARHDYARLRTVRMVRDRKAVNRIYLAIAAVVLGGGGYLLRDDIKHWYYAAARTGRVVGALAVNINDYRTVIKQREATEDKDERDELLKACHKRCAERTLKVLEKNGSIFIKLGQHLSSMGYLLPYEWTTTFIPLQDKCPVSSYESIEAMYFRDTGRRIDEDFAEFSRLPLGAASLAQVHTAVLKDSQQQVACKVQHPSLEEWVPLDLALTRYTFKTLKRAFPEYDLEWLSNEMDFSLPQELDFELEGKNAMRAKEYFANNTTFPLIIPNVISASRRFLVMDKVSGARIDNLEYLDSHSISRDEVSATLARIFNTMIFSSGAPLHCDPHGGNIAIKHNPKRRYPYNFDIILYDHGLYRMPENKLRRDYAKLWLSVIDANEQGMRKYAYEVAGITDEQFPLFASAITGRDYRVLLKSEIATSNRDASEKEAINDAFGDNLLEELVKLLGDVPRIILLILKTNDLTRSLDEGLQTNQGPIRTFMILAKYASRTVWDEQKELLRQRGHLFQPSNWFPLFKAWANFARVEIKLFVYERYLSVKRHLHLDQEEFGKL